MPNTSLREPAPTTSLRDATRTLSTSAQCPILLFLGCANDFSTRRYANATSLREAAPTTPLSTSQYKCLMPY
ncbi:MAG: hypothetical protein ACYTXA_16445 [Nostoc sp.]